MYEKARYGLEIIEMIEKATEGKESLGFGSLYPTLSRLSRKGLLKSIQVQEDPKKRGDKMRKYYALTPLGLAALNELEALRKTLRNWSSAH